MQNKWLKNITVIAIILTMLGTLYFKLYEPEFQALNWQPLPEIDHELGQSRVYQSHHHQAIGQAKQILRKGRVSLGVPGISIAVGIQGETVWAAGYGYADIDKQKTIAINTQFRIGSTSKALTSLALGQLLQSKQLQLDDAIGKYLPNLPKALRQITVRQLASHQSGIRSYGHCLCLPSDEYYNNDEYTSVSEAIETFIHDPLLFQPGENFAYSSYNYTLLSAVMEQVADKPFLQLMQNQVFEPLGMSETAADHAKATIPYQASFYNTGYGHYQLAYTVNNSNKWAGGGFLSTPSDLVKMANQLLSGNYLQADTLALLFEPQKLNNGDVNPQQYALGWRHSTKSIDGNEKVHYVHHGGTAAGSTSLLIMFPESHLAVSVLINGSIMNFGDLWDVSFDIAQTFLKNQ
ncbi:MAG: beta-lactamase family protein [Algicola sp.]|nr:beta-lactamase family protein [Algicola sp.]